MFIVYLSFFGSGFTIGFVILASGRIYTIEDDISLFVLIFIQFQMIGLTISKFDR
jgi:hypothetical protein